MNGLAENRLYLGDSLELLRKLPSGSVDLVLTDPPYNIGKAGWDRIDGYTGWSLRWMQEYEALKQEYEALRYPHHCDPNHRNLLRIDTVGSADARRIHICQKPFDLLRRLIRVSSNPGALVLDPFAGSGSTLIAAIQEGRRYIGFERDETTYRTALDWLTTERAQTRLEGV